MARFNPLDLPTVRLFESVLCGDFALNGFRNHDLQQKFYPDPPPDHQEARRRTQRTSRLIRKLRGHGLISKVKDARLYRVTPRGIKAMWPAVRFRKQDFPLLFNSVPTFAQA